MQRKLTDSEEKFIKAIGDGEVKIVLDFLARDGLHRPREELYQLIERVNRDIYSEEVIRTLAQYGAFRPLPAPTPTPEEIRLARAQAPAAYGMKLFDDSSIVAPAKALMTQAFERLLNNDLDAAIQLAEQAEEIQKGSTSFRKTK